MIQYLKSLSAETLICVPMLVIIGIYLVVVEIKSWKEKGHSALF